MRLANNQCKWLMIGKNGSTSSLCCTVSVVGG